MEQDVCVGSEAAAVPPWNDPLSASGAEADSEEPTARQQKVRAACLFFNVLCGFTNGYDICVTSVVLHEIVREFALCGEHENAGSEVMNCARKQAVFSFASAGSLCAKFCLPWLADRFGRRCAMAIVDSLIIISVALQFLARSATVLLLGRVVLGMGMGFAFIVEPLYVTEIAPPSRRGQFVVMNEVAVCFGCLLGLQLAALLVDGRPEAWRTAVAIGGIPAVVQLLFIFALPESPRWLAVRGDLPGLEVACRRLGISRTEVECLQDQAMQAMMRPDDDSKVDGHRGYKNLKRACLRQHMACDKHGTSFILALCFTFFVTASGNLAMQAYVRDILLSCGVEQPLQLLPLVGWMKLAGALVAMVGADAECLGRRRLAIVGGVCCTLCDVVLAVRHQAPDLVPPAVSAIMLFFFIFSWNAGFGGVQFAVTMEMLPNEMRSIWAGQIFGIVGFAEILIYQLFETLLYSSGVVTFSVFTAVNACGVLFAICFLPDMRGQSLEEGVAELASPSPSPTGAASNGLPTVNGNGHSSNGAGCAEVPTRGKAGSLTKIGRRYEELVDELPEPVGLEDGARAGHSLRPQSPSVELARRSNGRSNESVPVLTADAIGASTSDGI
mmetsp:Transcript_119557/g.217253  ORF Transcript_119557/g.217253 Transcript_119557/m.217253 type:complete len:613 (+) Transcript_119557:57-1895(+)